MFGLRDGFHFTVSPALFALSMVEKLQQRQNNDDDIEREARDKSVEIEPRWTLVLKND